MFGMWTDDVVRVTVELEGPQVDSGHPERLHAAGHMAVKAHALAAFARGLIRHGPALMADLVGDDTGSAFRRAMEAGLP